MKTQFMRILKSAPIRSLVNPKYGTDVKITKGNICIVISESNSLGDLIMRNHTVHQLRRKYSVTVAITEWFYQQNKAFFDNHSLHDALVILPSRKREWPSFVRQLRQRNIQAVLLDMQPLVKEVFFYFAGIPVIVSAEGTSPWSTREFVVDKYNFHYTKVVSLALEMLCGETLEQEKSPYFRFKKNNTGELTLEKGISLALHAGGQTSWNRRWPIEKYVLLCRLFLENYEGRIFLIGGQDEYVENERIKNALEENFDAEGRVLNFSGVDLNTTANVIDASTLFLGNDSGPMHMATALQKRVIAIFGPSWIRAVSPEVFDPCNGVVHSDLACVPCMKHTCGLPREKQYACLNQLPVNAVWRKLQNQVEAAVVENQAALVASK